MDEKLRNMEDKLLRQFEILYKKMTALENQVTKLEIILTNLDYIKNSIDKTKNTNTSEDLTELCNYMKKLSIRQPSKVRKPVSPYAVWTKEELEKPPEYRLKFPKQFLETSVV